MRLCKVVIAILLGGCWNDRLQTPTLYSDVTPESGIDFTNTLAFTERMNPYTYRNFYNGAGVAIGDINNDGLQDVFFAGNQVDNKLFLNEGNLVFRDITQEAGVGCPGVWSTGATFADVNGDGLLDLYVCKSGDPETPNRHNELFINNGDLTFTERAKEYGLDVTGLSVQAAFFDFDKDDDLDCYLLTNSIKSVGQYDLVVNQREVPDPLGGGNKFFINEGGRFRDYSEEAGIYRSNIGFGLGITLGDFNHDSWPDIFVSNDFFERDYLYINDRKGSFVESLTDYFESISMGSMGADYADLDNDGLAELFVTEMLPDSLNRRKTKTLYESWDKYCLNVERGYHHQFPRNVLQKEISPGNFVEVGRLAGVSASEWSWGALMFDMDNDGLRDVFVANGIYKDLLDRDYLAYSADHENVRRIIRKEENAIIKLIEMMPSSDYPNFALHNKGDLKFENASDDWGLGEPMYSSGSAYGDFDNDGDLDLVVNNINGKSRLFRNNTDTSQYKSLTLSLATKTKNTFAVGTEVRVYAAGKIFFADNFVTRGFQSTVAPTVTIGLGTNIHTIDSIEINWPDSGQTVLYDPPLNSMLQIVRGKTGVTRHREATALSSPASELRKIEKNLFRHQASGLVDFNRDRLLPIMYSSESPAMLSADINHDGVSEVYVTGGKGQHGALLSFSTDEIVSIPIPALEKEAAVEETRGAFADFDGDGDLDYYMASGGRFYPRTSSVLMDKIFMNDGQGGFSESPVPLPFKSFVSTSVVKVLDFDNDGDNDLLIGERFDPFSYGTGGNGYLLQNVGGGAFEDVTATHAPALNDIGMITDIEVGDFNTDGWVDAIIVGDWMPVIMLRNKNGNFEDASGEEGMKGTEGWWHDIESADLNGDEKPDFVLGNHGRNSFFKPGDVMYVNDFDRNGSIEQIFCTAVDGKYYPIVDKDEFLSQLPGFKKTLLFYKDYGKKSIDELIPATTLAESVRLQVNMLSSMILLSEGDGYRQIMLPLEAQFSPVYALLVTDLDHDGVKDIIAGGNHFMVKPQFGRYDGSSGWFFKGSLVNGEYQVHPGIDLGVKGQIRDIKVVKSGGIEYILFAKHNEELEIYEVSAASFAH